MPTGGWEPIRDTTIRIPTEEDDYTGPLLSCYVCKDGDYYFFSHYLDYYAKDAILWILRLREDGQVKSLTRFASTITYLNRLGLTLVNKDTERKKAADRLMVALEQFYGEAAEIIALYNGVRPDAVTKEYLDSLIAPYESG